MPEGYRWPEIFDLSFAIVSAVACVALEHIFEKLLYPWYYTVCKEKNDLRMRDIRTKKAVNNIFKFFYYSFASFAGWYTLKDTFLLPPALGGKGDLHNSL
jgi:hypothetical protein